MSEHLRRKTSHDAGASVAVGFVLGALVGASVALLVAPASGKDTRRRLADAGGRMGDAAREALDRARDAATDLGRGTAWGAEHATRGQRSPTQATDATPESPSRG